MLSSFQCSHKSFQTWNVDPIKGIRFLVRVQLSLPSDLELSNGPNWRSRSLLYHLRGAEVISRALRYGLLCVRDLKPAGRPMSWMPTACFYQVNSWVCSSKVTLFTLIGSATHIPLSPSCTFTYLLTFYLLYFNRFWQPLHVFFHPLKMHSAKLFTAWFNSAFLS